MYQEERGVGRFTDERSLGKEVNEREVTDGASEKLAQSRKQSQKRNDIRKKKTLRNRAPNLPSPPVQNDKGTKPSETPASAVTVAKDTVLENRGKKHSPEGQTPTAAASLLTASAPARNSSK